MSLASTLRPIFQQNSAPLQSKSWWNDYQTAYYGGKDALTAWMGTAAQRYPDWDQGAVDFTSKQLTALQDAASAPDFIDKAAGVAAGGGRVGALGALAGAAYLGGTAALGAGAEGTAAAGGTGLGTGAAAAGGGGEAILGSGLTAGTTTGAVGGGSLGSGLTAGTATGAVGGGSLGAGLAAAGGGALAPGFFAGETAAPVLGGATAAASTGLAGAGGTGSGVLSGAAAGGAGVGGVSLGKLLSGDVSAGDLASTVTLGDLGKLLATGASMYGANEQSNKLDALAHEYMNLGAPSRARYEASFDPNFDITKLPGLQGALDTSSQSLLRGLSTQGNPFGNPGGLTEAMKYITGNVALPALQNYRNQNAASGGYGAFSTAAPGAATGAINAGGNVYSDLGRGIANITNPPTSLEQALKSMKGLV